MDCLCNKCLIIDWLVGCLINDCIRFGASSTLIVRIKTLADNQESGFRIDVKSWVFKKQYLDLIKTDISMHHCSMIQMLKSYCTSIHKLTD